MRARLEAYREVAGVITTPVRRTGVMDRAGERMRDLVRSRRDAIVAFEAARGDLAERTAPVPRVS